MGGPLPRFSPPHLWMALELIGKHKRIGRGQLAKIMKLGEGSVRTILERLNKLGLVLSARGGSCLSERGKKLLDELPTISEIKLRYLSLGKISMISKVPGGSVRVTSGMEQRDAAVQIGGKGATVLVFKKGKLRFPDGIEVRKEADAILAISRPEEGDAIIVGFGDDRISAELATKAAVLSLLPKISKIFTELCRVS
ncbi:MAG: DUF4443 domain-containing protein [Candidatus Hadarchaeales archaeon]